VVWYFEDWTDVEAFERHLRSDRFARLLSVLELSAEPPRLECRLISESRGLDYLAAVRGVTAWTSTAARLRKLGPVLTARVEG